MSAEGPTEDELDEEFNSLPEEDQQALLDEFNADSWDELNYIEKLDALGYDDETGDGGGGDEDPPEVSTLQVFDGLELVGDNSASITVAGVDVPGATEITMSGEGRESQYLRETETGGEDGGNEFFEGGDSNTDSGGGEDSGPRMGGSPSGGEEPPLHIEIIGRMGQQRAEQFVSLRDRDEVFSVSIGDASFEDMELHDFTRDLTAEHPHSFEFRLEVVEWREVELQELDMSEFFGNGSEEEGSSDGGGPGNASEFQSGTADDPEVYDLGGGEQRNFQVGDGESARNAIIDTTSEGAGGTIYADGSDWDVSGVGWRAEDNRSGIVGRGDGSVDKIFLGHGGDSGVVGELIHTVDISNVNLQNSSNGIRLTDDVIENLEVAPPSGGSGGGGGGGGGSAGSADYTSSLSSPSVFDDTYAADTISSASSPTYGSDGAMQTTTYSGSHTGGYGQIRTSSMFGSEVEEMHQRYYIYFGGSTAPNDNCKMPGFNGDYSRTLAGETEPNGSNGWSARGAYRSSGGGVEPGFYVYHVDQSSWWGNYVWSGTTLSTDQWYQIDQYIRLNTPGENDGALALWVDGSQVYSDSSWRWRDTSDLKIESFWHDFYHGGDNTPSSTYHIYTDEYSAWSGGSPM